MSITTETSYTSTSKICRLCTKELCPSLCINIFGTNVDLAGKIRDLLPFNVDEFDDLPHKICILCSAKIIELHDFVTKCIESQTFFHQVTGKPPFKKSTILYRKRWSDKEKRLQQNNYCNALAKNVLNSLETGTEEQNETLPSFTIKSNSHKLKNLKIVLKRIDNGENDSADDTPNTSAKYELRKNSMRPKPIARKSPRLVNVLSTNNTEHTKRESKSPISLRKKPAIENRTEPCQATDSATLNVMERKHPYLLTQHNVNENPLYPCISERAVIEHLQRLKKKLNMKYESLELTKQNGSAWVCVP